MKLCYLASGASIHTQRWVNYFVDQGHDVHIITDAPYDYKSLEVHTLKNYSHSVKVGLNSNRIVNFALWATMIKSLIHKIDPDILHCHYLSSYGVLGTYSGFHPSVISVWGGDLRLADKSCLYNWMIRHIVRKTDIITCDGKHVKERLVSLGANPQKIRLIYFGTNTQQFCPEQRNENTLKDLGVFGSPVIISVRRLEPLYNIESLIAAVPLVLKEVPSAKFIIAGNGSLEIDLKGQAKSLGISESIRFIGDIPNTELPKYLASSDIYISTALADAGLSASTAEAMSCALPVIITDFGDNSKWVEDGVNGLVIPLKNPAILADKIVYLLRNHEVGRKFGLKSRQVIEENNSYYRQMAKVEAIYQDLMEESNK